MSNRTMKATKTAVILLSLALLVYLYPVLHDQTVGGITVSEYFASDAVSLPETARGSEAGSSEMVDGKDPVKTVRMTPELARKQRIETIIAIERQKRVDGIKKA